MQEARSGVGRKITQPSYFSPRFIHHTSNIIHQTSYIEEFIHHPSSIIPMNVEADFIKEALDAGLYKQGVTMYLQLHNAKFNKE